MMNTQLRRSMWPEQFRVLVVRAEVGRVAARKKHYSERQQSPQSARKASHRAATVTLFTLSPPSLSPLGQSLLVFGFFPILGVLGYPLLTPIVLECWNTLGPAYDGATLENFREYLHLLARLQLNPRWQGKIDLSGVVQQTLLEAHQVWDQLSGWEEHRRAAWLRKALAHNLADEIRKLGAVRRGIVLEKSIDRAMEESSARLESWLADERSSPAARAERNEQVLALASALAQLAPDQRTAVELRHLQGCSLEEVARRMDRRKEAVAKLLFRGLKRLRDLMMGYPE